MASIADARHPARRWALAALLRRFSASARPRSVEAPAHTAVVEAAARAESPRKKRSYAPPRDAFLENSAMRREMYRL
jgi:hypothetical protein